MARSSARALAFCRDVDAMSMAVSREAMVKALRRVADEIETGALAARRVSVRQVAMTEDVALLELQLEAAIAD
jgi:hypothetical protein